MFSPSYFYKQRIGDMFIWDPWKTPIPKELETPLERILFLHNKIKKNKYIQIRGPTISGTHKRDTWTFHFEIQDYRSLFPETKPKFILSSLKEAYLESRNTGWTALQIESIDEPLWNPESKSWENPTYCAKIGFISAVEPYRGKDLVSWAFQIMYWLGVKTTTLLDRSHIECPDSPNGELDLALMRFSTKGQTFYESLGFQLAPENPSNRIANPNDKLHEIWQHLTKDVNWKNLQETWYQGFQFINDFQKATSKGTEIPSMTIHFWDDSKIHINHFQSWMEFISYWHQWGYSLFQLHKQYPKTKSPFEIYPALERIPPGECGDLYNWFLILYQITLSINSRTYHKAPIKLQMNHHHLIIPGALEAQKWNFLQRNTEYTAWVAVVKKQ